MKLPVVAFALAASLATVACYRAKAPYSTHKYEVRYDPAAGQWVDRVAPAVAEVRTMAALDTRCAPESIQTTIIEQDGPFPIAIATTGCGSTLLYKRRLRRSRGRWTDRNTRWELYAGARVPPQLAPPPVPQAPAAPAPVQAPTGAEVSAPPQDPTAAPVEPQPAVVPSGP